MYNNISQSMPSFVTTDNIKFTVDLTEKLGKLTRAIIDLSNQFILLPPAVIFVQKGTYFISVIKMPGSIYYLAVSVLEIRKVNSLKTGAIYIFVISQNVSLLVKDTFDILKGMKAFGCLDERYFVVFKALPILGAVSTVFIATQFYGEIVERSLCKAALLNHDLTANAQDDTKRMALLHQYKRSTVSLATSVLKISGMALMTLSPFFLVPVAIPAHFLLTTSAICSLYKVFLP